MNSVAKAALNGISTAGASLFVTVSPCMHCAKLILQSGIKEVYYDKIYRITDSIEFLQNHGVKITYLE